MRNESETNSNERYVIYQDGQRLGVAQRGAVSSSISEPNETPDEFWQRFNEQSRRMIQNQRRDEHEMTRLVLWSFGFVCGFLLCLFIAALNNAI